jgi:hypothetical protein
MIAAGSTFAGAGTLINLNGATLTIENGANIDVRLANQGALELGASPGQVQGTNFQQSALGSLEIELAGTNPNNFDQLTLTGQALLAGELKVSLLGGFSPIAGNVFSFLSAAGGISGTFDIVSLPALMTGLSWSINYNPTNVQLTVVQALAGDFNGNGTVDAADYVVWRNSNGTQAAYDTWRAHFGATAGAGNGSSPPTAEPASAGVPEPTSALLLVFGIAAGSIRARRTRVSRKMK